MGKTLNKKHSELLQNAEYSRKYEELQEEFNVARELIRARMQAGLTQQEVAQRMGTTQSVIARMESGKPMPSLRSLKRYAQATGNRIKISFEADA